MMKRIPKGFGEPKYSYTIRVEAGELLDFAGEQVLARVFLTDGKERWKGWATTAADTADGYSICFPGALTRKSQNRLLTAKHSLREQMGKELSERLGVPYSKTGDDYIETLFFTRNNLTP